VQVNEVARYVNGGKLAPAIRDELLPGCKATQDKAAFGRAGTLRHKFLAASKRPDSEGQLI
jgi:hypothetical protein